MTLGEIIKAYRIKKNMSMGAFAKASGMSKTYVSMLEKNKNNKTGKEIVPTVEYIQKAAKGMLMDFDDLFDMVNDTVKTQLDETFVGEKAVLVPVLKKIAAGISISAINDILGYEEISEKMAHTGSIFALKIKGNSMEPKIDNDSIVIVRQQEDAESGSIVIVQINGNDAICKKLVKINNGMASVSLNPLYDPMIFTLDEVKSLPIKIIGKVIEIRTKC